MKETKKISHVLIGRSIRAVWNYIFDYIIYALVLLKFGYVLGTVIMTSAALCENLIMLRIYRRMKIDWLGYDYISRIRKWGKTHEGFRKKLGLFLSRSESAQFVILSIFRDAFETTAYFKHIHPEWKNKSHNLIFIGAVILGNLYWSAGVEIFINSWLSHIISF